MSNNNKSNTMNYTKDINRLAEAVDVETIDLLELHLDFEGVHSYEFDTEAGVITIAVYTHGYCEAQDRFYPGGWSVEVTDVHVEEAIIFDSEDEEVELSDNDKITLALAIQGKF